MIRYWIATPRSSGIVAFENETAGAAMLEDETTSWFRIAFRHMSRQKALTHWLEKGYFVRYPVVHGMTGGFDPEGVKFHGLPND